MILPTLILLSNVLGAQDANAELIAQCKSTLTATGFNFAPTASGKSYSIVFDHPNGRKQTVYLGLVPSKNGGLVTYNLYTQVWFGSAPPDEALMQKILSRTKKIGAFYLFKDAKGAWAIRFAAKFDATDVAKIPKAEDPLVVAFKDTVFFVNAVGEEIDKELNGEGDN